MERHIDWGNVQTWKESTPVRDGSRSSCQFSHKSRPTHTHTLFVFIGKRAARIKAKISVHLPSRTMFWLSSHNALCQGKGPVDWLTSRLGFLFLFPSHSNNAQANSDSSGTEVVLNYMCRANQPSNIKVTVGALCMHESYACSILHETCKVKEMQRTRSVFLFMIHLSLGSFYFLTQCESPAQDN